MAIETIFYWSSAHGMCSVYAIVTEWQCMDPFENRLDGDEMILPFSLSLSLLHSNI